MNGGMVCIRGEGWKEVKIGLVNDFEPDWTGKQTTIKLKDMMYSAVIGDSQPLHLFYGHWLFSRLFPTLDA
jgi:hypothetical protein